MIKINGYFTDGCVIQADSEFSIAGKTAPLAEVRADLCEKETLSFCVRADENGDFSVLIPPIKGGLSTYSLAFASSLIAFGGVSVLVQSVCFLKKANVKIPVFLLAKTIQTAISFLLTLALTFVVL